MKPGVPREEILEFVAFLGALCLFFSTLEYLFPKPLPFFRLGIANIPVLIALEFLSPAWILLLILLKVLGHGLINGTLGSYVFLFSAAGSFSSGLIMLAAYRAGGRRISLIGVSIAGALVSNLVQIGLSILFIFGEAARIIAPLFLLLGLASGVLVGFFAERFARTSVWLERIRRRYG